ncbi:MAG: hypothetical protein V4505_16410 [Pseudomonadota bacterium]
MDHFFCVDNTTRASLLSLFNTVKRTPFWPQAQGSCFCMAGFLALVFNSRGVNARVSPCYAAVTYHEDRYALGVKGFRTGDNQVEGHVVCIVDENIIIDFGTTNIRRYFIPSFPVAIAAAIQDAAVYPTEIDIAAGMKIRWHEDNNPQTDRAVEAHKAASRFLFDQYQKARLHNRQMRRQTATA